MIQNQLATIFPRDLNQVRHVCALWTLWLVTLWVVGLNPASGNMWYI